MYLNKLLIYRLLVTVILIFCLIFLLSGSEYLIWRVKILFGFHTGTVVSWLVLTSASLLAISINRRNPKLAFLSSVSFYISIFWLLISFLLAGNNNLVFHSRPITFNFWVMISGFPVMVLVVSLGYNTLMLFDRLRKRKT